MIKNAPPAPTHQNVNQIMKIITDLDQSDNNQIESAEQQQAAIPVHHKPRKQHLHHRRNQIEIKKYSGNFPRSKSAEKDNILKNAETNSYLKILVNTKDEQIAKLIQKVNDLHNYNDEFSLENERLQSDLQAIIRKNEILTLSLDEAQRKTCDNCSSWLVERENLLKTNKTLKDDVEMIKTLVYRLNVQLERYQDKFRKSNIDIDDERTTTCRSETPINREEQYWGSVNTHTLGPLLNSYEEFIREKDDIISQNEIEMNRFTGNLKEVLEENERLQKDICEIRKGKDGWREERTRLQAQLDICRSKAELQTRRGDLAKEKLVEVLRCYEQKVQSQSLDLERLQEAYGRAKGELISYKNLNSQPDIIMESWKECQRLFEELKSQYSNDKTKILNEITELKDVKANLEGKISNLKDENLKFKTENEVLTKNLCETTEKMTMLKKSTQKLKESRDRLKARLRIALQWAQKLDESRQKMKNTWDDLKQLEAIVRHKESQIRGLHIRHLEEVGILEKKLVQRDETIKTILKDKAKI